MNAAVKKFHFTLWTWKNFGQNHIKTFEKSRKITSNKPSDKEMRPINLLNLSNEMTFGLDNDTLSKYINPPSFLPYLTLPYLSLNHSLFYLAARLH